MTTITCPNGVTHTTTSDDSSDWVEFIITKDNLKESYNQFTPERYFEEWEVEEFADDGDPDFMRSLYSVNVDNLRSVVDETKSMDVYEIAKCFGIDYFACEGWVRYIDDCEVEHENFNN